VRRLGDQGSGIWWLEVALRRLLGLGELPNRSRVLLRSLEGFDYCMQEAYEERNGEGRLKMVGGQRMNWEVMREEQHEEQVGDRDQAVGEVEWEGNGEQKNNWGLPLIAEVEGEGSRRGG
jgi:hypothetical protein